MSPSPGTPRLLRRLNDRTALELLLEPAETGQVLGHIFAGVVFNGIVPHAGCQAQGILQRTVQG